MKTISCHLKRSELLLFLYPQTGIILLQPCYWCQIPMEYLETLGGRFYFNVSNFDLKYIPIDLLPLAFYEDAFKAWQEINYRSPIALSTINSGMREVWLDFVSYSMVIPF